MGKKHQFNLLTLLDGYYICNLVIETKIIIQMIQTINEVIFIDISILF
jgi:hypothetical protein